ncbi:hypothetical protein [Olleya sp. R77988]|uniref:hypothetical protein n=1 Tax=Olleya sp. R77988 TaxID=3093875 RepID=UPI0037CCB327
MSNKKNIDRLFQEKFKDFEVKPDAKVWQNIQSKLKEEEDDKPVVIIPLWLKLSGIAASFTLLLFLGNSIFNTNNNPVTPSIVDGEKTRNNIIIKDSSLNNKNYIKKIDIKSTEKINNNELIATQKEDIKNPIENNKKTSTTSYYNKLNNKQLTSNNNTNKPTNKVSFNKKNTIARNTTLIKQNNITVLNKPTNNIDKTSVDNKNVIKKDKQLIDNKNKTDIKEAVAETNLKKNPIEKEKTSIEDAIAENEKTEDLIEKEDVTNRWKVNANIAPVYYNTIGKGSHLDEQFNENNKSGEINTSYGVKVGYAINDKFTVRSGINRLNLSYDTDDVVVYKKFNSSTSNSFTSINNSSVLRNVNFITTTSGQQLSMISANNVNTMEVSRSLNAAISQRMSYFEVPLEIEYKLIDKNFGINLIGGLSTFILNDNQVVSELNGSKTKIGEANNINSVSFSANFGIGLNYAFSKSVVFNFEPTFKYQLNAYSNTSGDFNPYIVGVYSGFTYKF